MRADDGAFAEGRGCYTSVRIEGGRARHEERHLQRLARGARDLDLGRFDERAARQALTELAREACVDGEGIVRIQLSRDASGTLHVVAVPRGLGADPAAWSAITAPLPHVGPTAISGQKLTNRLVLALAGDAARAAGADEALVFDRAGHLVEGTRSNVVVLREDGELVTPPLCRGGVAGVGLQILLERVSGLSQRDVSARQLHRAREVLVVNSARGARTVATLDGRPLHRSEPSTAVRLDEAMAAG